MHIQYLYTQFMLISLCFWGGDWILLCSVCVYFITLLNFAYALSHMARKQIVRRRRTAKKIASIQKWVANNDFYFIFIFCLLVYYLHWEWSWMDGDIVSAEEKTPKALFEVSKWKRTKLFRTILSMTCGWDIPHFGWYQKEKRKHSGRDRIYMNASSVSVRGGGRGGMGRVCLCHHTHHMWTCQYRNNIELFLIIILRY